MVYEKNRDVYSAEIWFLLYTKIKFYVYRYSHMYYLLIYNKT